MQCCSGNVLSLTCNEKRNTEHLFRTGKVEGKKQRKCKTDDTETEVNVCGKGNRQGQ